MGCKRDKSRRLWEILRRKTCKQPMALDEVLRKMKEMRKKAMRSLDAHRNTAREILVKKQDSTRQNIMADLVNGRLSQNFYGNPPKMSVTTDRDAYKAFVRAERENAEDWQKLFDCEWLMYDTMRKRTTSIIEKNTFGKNFRAINWARVLKRFRKPNSAELKESCDVLAAGLQKGLSQLDEMENLLKEAYISKSIPNPTPFRRFHSVSKMKMAVEPALKKAFNDIMSEHKAEKKNLAEEQLLKNSQNRMKSVKANNQCKSALQNVKVTQGHFRLVNRKYSRLS